MNEKSRGPMCATCARQKRFICTAESKSCRSCRKAIFIYQTCERMYCIQCAIRENKCVWCGGDRDTVA